jgi:hypothetical protein
MTDQFTASDHLPEEPHAAFEQLGAYVVDKAPHGVFVVDAPGPRHVVPQQIVGALKLAGVIYLTTLVDTVREDSRPHLGWVRAVANGRRRCGRWWRGRDRGKCYFKKKTCKK